MKLTIIHKRKIYAFSEWGFNANFIYLTGNSCQTIRDADIDIEQLQGWLNEGYTIVVAGFNKEKVDSLMDQLRFNWIDEKEWYSFENLYVFIVWNWEGEVEYRLE